MLSAADDIDEDAAESSDDEDSVEENVEEVQEEVEEAPADDLRMILDTLKVAELKELLKAAGKPVSGKKDELIARLME